MTIPFVCLLAAFLLIYAIKIPLAVAMARVPGGYDNKHPRENQAKLDGWGRRALGAHLNAFENFAPFAAGVFVAHLAGADPRRASALALTYVAARVLHPILYIANLDKLRSLDWLIGFLATVGLFVLPLLR